MVSFDSLRFGLPSLLAVAGFVSVAAAGPKILPVLNKPIADLSSIPIASVALNLNNAFGTEAIDNQVVRFTSQFVHSDNTPIILDMALFSNRTPVTRTNFLNYVSTGNYVNSFIHRSVPGFVIQGGSFYVDAGDNIQEVPTNPPIANEFGVSNTLGTISMAKADGDPNSATSGWFVSLGENSNKLDPQNGGFTVFGRVTKDTFVNAQLFGYPYVFPIYSYPAPFSELPLFYKHVAYSSLIPDLILFTDVSMVPLPAGQAGETTTLTYTVVSNSNPVVAAASIQSPATLNLVPQAGQTGTTNITVRATDSVGNTVNDTFSFTVNPTDTYATWATRTTFPGGQSGAGQDPDGDSLANLPEYAFLGDPAVASQAPLPVPGKTGLSPAPQFLTLSFALRKFTSGLSYVVEANDQLSGTWSPVWSSADGLGSAQVVSFTDQADRTLVTIKDNVTIGSRPQRYMRVRVAQAL